jgi:hypothetical protein
MLDWLDADTTKTPADSRGTDSAPSSGEGRGVPVFPVSRNAKPLPGLGNGPLTRVVKPFPGFPVFPVSKQGGRGDNSEKSPHPTGPSPHAIPATLPGLLDAVAAHLTPDEAEHLRALSTTAPDIVANACRLILTTPDLPTPEDVAELDRRILALCDLEPWLAARRPDQQVARRRMALVDVPRHLARFADWICEAEGARRPGWGRSG